MRNDVLFFYYQVIQMGRQLLPNCSNTQTPNFVVLKLVERTGDGDQRERVLRHPCCNGLGTMVKLSNMGSLSSVIF